MTGLFLPARLLFVEYISDDWFGSFGIISAIAILIIVLTKKKKLGFFGPMLERQIYKFQKGKKGALVFGQSLFLLFILGLLIFTIEQGNSVYAELKNTAVTTSMTSEISEKDTVLEYANNLDASDWLFGFLMAPVIFLTAFPQMSAAIASIDQSLDGWLLHFYTVGFVEYLEMFGILVYYRISSSRTKKKSTSSATHVCAKTPI